MIETDVETSRPPDEPVIEADMETVEPAAEPAPGTAAEPSPARSRPELARRSSA